MDVRVLIIWVGILFSVFAQAALPRGDGFVLELEALRQPLATVLENVARANRLGATHFNVPVLLCQKNERSNIVRWCDAPSKTKEKLFTLVHELKQRGNSVGVLAFLEGDNGTWRGFFEPSDFNAWSDSYGAHLIELADWSVVAGASELIVGSELNRLYVSGDSQQQRARTTFWKKILAELHEQASGMQILLVANWDQWDKIPFWDSSDAIGLSAYYPLVDSEDSDSSVEALAHSWQLWSAKLLALSKKHQRPLYFSEVGYSSMKSSAHEPWRYEPPTPLDLELQARLFEAFGQVWASNPSASDSLSRFMVWALSLSDDPQHDWGFAVFGKPSERVLASVFRTRYSRW